MPKFDANLHDTVVVRTSPLPAPSRPNPFLVEPDPYRGYVEPSDALRSWSALQEAKRESRGDAE